MALLWFLFNSSSADPHRSYKAYLKDPPRPKAHKFTKLRKLVSRSLRGHRPRGSHKLLTSEDILPYEIPDDLPSYEESEPRDGAEVHRQSVDLWRFKDSGIRLTVIDTLVDGRSSRNFSTLQDFLFFIRDQIDQVRPERIRLQRKVASLGQDPDKGNQQNTEARELNELLQLHVDAELGLTEEGRIRDTEDRQRCARRQETGDEPRTSWTGWWHPGLNPVPSDDEMGVY
ncbi:MAG: hypothetical protein Q9199_002279 [Rusavskia elegans]